jgi:hypothetical protein
MAELLEWLGRYSPGVVALLALAAAALFVLKLSVERGIQAGFEAQAKAAELSLTRRSAFEERILTERYTLVTGFAARLERLATQLNRIRHGQQAPDGFYRGSELVPLTEILEELSIHRLVLGEAFYDVLNRQALLLLAVANGDSGSPAAQLGASWLAARDQVRALAEEQFRIESIRF